MRITHVVKDDERIVLDMPDGARMEPLSPSSEDAYLRDEGNDPSRCKRALAQPFGRRELLRVVRGSRSPGANRRRTGMASAQIWRLHTHSRRG